MPDEGAGVTSLSATSLLSIGVGLLVGLLIVYLGERMEFDIVLLSVLAVLVFVGGLLLIFRRFVWDTLGG